MPNYDYECQGCFEVFEQFHKMSETPEIVCPKCGKEDNKRLITGCAITGTRDSFGIGRNFITTDENGNKKEITNWTEWERAGYRNPLDVVKNEAVREGIKRKMEKITKYDNKARVTI